MNIEFAIIDGLVMHKCTFRSCGPKFHGEKWLGGCKVSFITLDKSCSSLTYQVGLSNVLKYFTL